jgi:hypothetical protein
MKKVMVFFVLLILMFGFILTGCDNGSGGSGGNYTIIIKNTSSSQTIGRVIIYDVYAGVDLIDETPNIGPGGQKTYNPPLQANGSDVQYTVVICDASGNGGPVGNGTYSRGEWPYPEDFPITHVWDGTDITSIHADGKQY